MTTELDKVFAVNGERSSGAGQLKKIVAERTSSSVKPFTFAESKEEIKEKKLNRFEMDVYSDGKDYYCSFPYKYKLSPDVANEIKWENLTNVYNKFNPRI